MDKALRKAVFIDKDGTLIPDVPYNVDPSLITLNNGVIEGLNITCIPQFSVYNDLKPGWCCVWLF